MKKILYIGLIIMSVLTLSSCKLFSYELNLSYEERMAYSIYSASSILTSTDNMDINELNYTLPLQTPVDDPTEDYLIKQLDHYYRMFNNYLGKRENNLAYVKKDIEIVDGYEHSFNFMIDSVEYHIVYNKLDVIVTDEVGDINGLMYIKSRNNELALKIEGVTNSKENNNKIYVKVLDNDDYVKIKFDDGTSGSKYSYDMKLNGIISSLKVQSMDYYNKSGFEVTEYVNGNQNTFEFMSLIDDGVESHKALYNVNGEKGKINISIEPDNTITYDISEGIRRGHQHIMEDKRNNLFK